MTDLPDAAQLVEASREFLEREILPTLGDDRLRFRTLVAINALSIAQRELDLGEGRVLSPEQLAELARQIRRGDIPAGILPLLKRHVAEKLRVASPKYLARYE